MVALTSKYPRIHVIELVPFGYRYYRGVFESFDEIPPKYTWKKIDYTKNETIVYGKIKITHAIKTSDDSYQFKKISNKD